MVRLIIKQKDGNVLHNIVCHSFDVDDNMLAAYSKEDKNNHALVWPISQSEYIEVGQV